jgi:hypothetical protein
MPCSRRKIRGQRRWPAAASPSAEGPCEVNCVAGKVVVPLLGCLLLVAGCSPTPAAAPRGVATLPITGGERPVRFRSASAARLDGGNGRHPLPCFVRPAVPIRCRRGLLVVVVPSGLLARNRAHAASAIAPKSAAAVTNMADARRGHLAWRARAIVASTSALTVPELACAVSLCDQSIT